MQRRRQLKVNVVDVLRVKLLDPVVNVDGLLQEELALVFDDHKGLFLLVELLFEDFRRQDALVV